MYEGEFREDKKHGRGTYRYATGQVYDGEWKAGKSEGRGTLRYADGDVDQGEFKAGKLYNGVKWRDKKAKQVVEGKNQGELSAEEAAELEAEDAESGTATASRR